MEATGCLTLDLPLASVWDKEMLEFINASGAQSPPNNST